MYMNRNWIPCYDQDLINQFDTVWNYVKDRFHIDKKPEFYLNKHKSVHNLGIFTAGRNIKPTIVLNEMFINHKDESFNTIIHEMCHYVAYHKFGGNVGHDVRWKNISKVVGEYFGEKITRCCEDSNKTLQECKSLKAPREYKFLVTCQECNRSWHYKKKTWWMNLKTKACNSACSCPCGSHHLIVEEL